MDRHQGDRRRRRWDHVVGFVWKADGHGGVREMMLSLSALVVLIVIAAVCGAIGRALAGRTEGGFISSIALGFIGALLGPWVAHQLKLSEPLMLHVSGQPFPIVWSIIGAALFVALLHLLSGRRYSTV